MLTSVADLMVSEVVTAHPRLTVGDVRAMMRRKEVHALPVVDGGGELIGIVSSTDLLAELPDDMAVGRIMQERVCTVPRYAAAHEAAEIMLEQRIHHLVVTDQDRTVGIISSFDLLRIVAEHRSPPDPHARDANKGKAMTD